MLNIRSFSHHLEDVIAIASDHWKGFVKIKGIVKIIPEKPTLLFPMIVAKNPPVSPLPQSPAPRLFSFSSSYSDIDFLPPLPNMKLFSPTSLFSPIINNRWYPERIEHNSGFTKLGIYCSPYGARYGEIYGARYGARYSARSDAR